MAQDILENAVPDQSITRNLASIFHWLNPILGVESCPMRQTCKHNVASSFPGKMTIKSFLSLERVGLQYPGEISNSLMEEQILNKNVKHCIEMYQVGDTCAKQ